MNSQESHVLKWVTLGKSDKMIADLFGIDEQDVKRQIDDISVKLNATSRIELSLKAIREGLV
jgi:DNA-binding NarL/FixJ family response regulator